MTELGLHYGVAAYADPTSRNRWSEPFRRAVEAHLEGNQQEAAAILSGLEGSTAPGMSFQELCEIRYLMSQVFTAAGDWELAEAAANRILEEAETTGVERWQGLAYHALASASVVQGHGAYAIDLAQRAKMCLVASGRQCDLARACHVLGTALLMTGDLRSGERELRSAVTLASLADEPLVEAMASRRLGVCFLQQGLYDAAARALEEAREAYLKVGATRRVQQTQHSLAVLSLTKGDLATARRWIDDASSGPNQVREALSVSRWEQLAAWLDICEGRSAEAIARLEKTCEYLRELDAQRDVALCLELLGDAFSLAGRVDEAAEAYSEGLRIGRMVSHSADVVVECLRKSGELALRRGRTSDAILLAREALTLTSTYRDKLEIAAIGRLRGLAKIKRQKLTGGIELLERAWRQFETLGAALEAQVTAQAMAALLTQHGRSYEAQVWTRIGGRRRLPVLDLLVGDVLPLRPKHEAKPRDLESLAAQAAEQGIITRDPRVLKALEVTQKGAASSLPLLIFGETGTGKELLAAVAHRFSGRPGAFVPINCAALPPDLLDAELFGHTRGAYTGALRDRPGLIEAATGGTLFLDEIGEMSLPVQGRLLRAIELGEIRRLGENRPRRVDTRFVGATHRDLSAMVRQGTYRPDLFFRLRGIVAVIPPLRERPWDTDALVDYFLLQISRSGGPLLRISPTARERLRSHPWPGNVRELKSVIERLATLPPEDGQVGVEDLDLDPVQVPGSLEEHLEDEERRRIVATLESVQWNRSRAADLLNLKRTTLVGKLRRLGIVPPSKK